MSDGTQRSSGLSRNNDGALFFFLRRLNAPRQRSKPPCETKWMRFGGCAEQKHGGGGGGAVIWVSGLNNPTVARRLPPPLLHAGYEQFPPRPAQSLRKVSGFIAPGHIWDVSRVDDQVESHAGDAFVKMKGAFVRTRDSRRHSSRCRA